MISYCPLDFDEQKTSPPRPNISQKIKPVQRKISENTECNYLVMFFVVGVFILTISDQIKN